MDVDAARKELGLPADRFAYAVGGGGIGQAWIVCKCIHCGNLFKSTSADMADVGHICRGDCGCKSK